MIQGPLHGSFACIECRTCPVRPRCTQICDDIELQLPSMETGRVDHEDLPRLYAGMVMTRIILDHEDDLTERQREVVRLYYREAHEQKEIAAMLGISQQAVSDHLEAVRTRLWSLFRKNREFQRASDAGVKP